MFGIPQLLRKAPKAIAFTLLGNLANSIVDFLFPAPNWGIYKKGTTTKAFDVSSVGELNIGGESNVSDYPVEDGTFTTYNKVLTPNMFAIRMTRDGSEEERAAFLEWLRVNVGNFELFDVLCPEQTYKNVTLKSYRVSRAANAGAAMITADCIFQEIRQIPVAYTSSNTPDPENQPATPTARTHPVPDRNVQGTPLPPL